MGGRVVGGLDSDGEERTVGRGSGGWEARGTDSEVEERTLAGLEVGGFGREEERRGSER